VGSKNNCSKGYAIITLPEGVNSETVINELNGKQLSKVSLFCRRHRTGGKKMYLRVGTDDEELNALKMNGTKVGDLNISVNCGVCLVIKNIPVETTKEEITKLFDKCDICDSARLVGTLDPVALISISQKDKSLALSLNGSSFKGSVIQVKECKEKKVFVGGVQPDMKEEFLLEKFGIYNPIDHYIIREKKIAFITFSSEEDAQSALNLNGFQNLRVNLAKEKEKQTKRHFRNLIVSNIDPKVKRDEISRIFGCESGAIRDYPSSDLTLYLDGFDERVTEEELKTEVGATSATIIRDTETEEV
jgi:RNA recognition motif-containing protein